MFENIHIIFGEATVGLLTLAIITYSFWFWRRSDRLEFKDFIHDIGNVSQSLAVVVFFLIYGLGLIIHDISDSLATQDLPRWTQCIPIVGEILQPHDRTHILFEMGNLPRNQENVGVTGIRPLGHEVFSQRKHVRGLLSSIYERSEISQVDQFLECPVTFAKRDPQTASRYVNSLFFNAKNWAYSHPNYFHEMEIIEQRIDFSRSASIVCFVGAVFLLFSILPVLIYRSETITGEFKNMLFRCSSFSKINLRVCCLLIVVLVALSWFSKLGFRAGSSHFDKRAFGYFYSYLHARDLYGTTYMDPRSASR